MMLPSCRSHFLGRRIITGHRWHYAPLSTGTAAGHSSTTPRPRRMHAYHLTGTGGPEGPQVTAYTTGRHALRTDLPRVMGGTDTAPQPVELVLGALMGCTQATVLFVARHMELPQQKQQRLQIHHCAFDLWAERDPRGALALPLDPTIPSRLQRVGGTLTLHLAASNEQLLPPDVLCVLKEQTEQRCPVANMMIASGCHMEIEWRQVVMEDENDG